MDKIKIKVYKTDKRLCGHVRLTPEAEKRLRMLQIETGLSARFLASQIILQATDDVEVEVEA